MKIHQLFLLLAVGVESLTISGIAHADTIDVANGDNNTIEQFSAGGVGSVFAGVAFTSNLGLNGPEGLAFDSAGNLFAANRSNTIEKFTPGGVGSLFVSTGPNTPFGIAFDGTGNLYVAYGNADVIEKFTPDGTGSVFASGVGSVIVGGNILLGGPTGLAFDRAGNLFVAIHSGASIEKITPDGVSSVFANLSTPFGLAFDSAGNLYAANEFGNSITKFTPGGIGTVFASDPGNGSVLNFPLGLAFDSSGNLYAANAGNDTIEKFTPGGVGSLFANTGLDTPTFFAITPGLHVPEPSTWSLLGFSLPALLSGARLRRRESSSTSHGLRKPLP